MDPEMDKSTDGVEQQPSETSAGAPSDTATAEEDAIEARARENLGSFLDPVEEETKEPEAKQPEEKPNDGVKPEDGGQQQESQEEQEADLPPIPKPEPRPSRLDRRIATVYIQNLLLSGEQDVPPIDELVQDLVKYPFEDKQRALHMHLARQRQLKGIRSTGQDELGEEDRDALLDAEVERRLEEKRVEEHETRVRSHFVGFINGHPELDETKKEFNPMLARAVETLWRGGMPIDKAYETVTGQIEAVKAEQEKSAAKEKQAALSGAVSASNDSKPSEGKLSWAEMAQLQLEDPKRWEELVKSGYTPRD
jgi:hypothetical protein